MANQGGIRNVVYQETFANGFDGSNGNGAWEVAARLGAIDLSEAAADNEATMIALALNWYLTNYTRVGFDIYSADSDAFDDDVLAAVIRFGLDF